MQKGLFALVLVAASFAGGAAINGPGLAWARGLLDKSGGPKVAAVASASAPPEGLEDPSGMTGARPGANSDIPESSRSPIGLEAPELGPAPLASRTGSDDPKASSAALDSLVPPDLGPPDVARNAEPASREAPAVVPAPPVPKPEAPAKTDRSLVRAGVTAAGKDWEGLRRRMHALGVTRYWIEGEPGGPCTFRCVIPTAGGQAVGQHFEAEGDDDFQAAEAALRRVALWKATESP